MLDRLTSVFFIFFFSFISYFLVFDFLFIFFLIVLYFALTLLLLRSIFLLFHPSKNSFFFELEDMILNVFISLRIQYYFSYFNTILPTVHVAYVSYAVRTRLVLHA